MKRSLLHQSFAVEKCIRGREYVVCNVNYLVSEKRLVKSNHQSKTASHFCVANGGADIRPAPVFRYDSSLLFVVRRR